MEQQEKSTNKQYKNTDLKNNVRDKFSLSAIKQKQEK